MTGEINIELRPEELAHLSTEEIVDLVRLEIQLSGYSLLAPAEYRDMLTDDEATGLRRASQQRTSEQTMRLRAQIKALFDKAGVSAKTGDGGRPGRLATGNEL